MEDNEVVKLVINSRGEEKDVPVEKIESPEHFDSLPHGEMFDQCSNLLKRLVRVEITDEDDPSKIKYVIPQNRIQQLIVSRGKTEMLALDEKGSPTGGILGFVNDKVRFITLNPKK